MRNHLEAPIRGAKRSGCSSSAEVHRRSGRELILSVLRASGGDLVKARPGKVDSVNDRPGGAFGIGPANQNEGLRTFLPSEHPSVPRDSEPRRSSRYLRGLLRQNNQRSKITC